MSDIITTLHPENDESVNLYPNIKKENIPSGSIDETKLDNDVLAILEGIDTRLTNAIASIEQPKYYSTLPTSDVGLIVYSDGYIYSWNGTAYTSTGIVYQATQLSDSNLYKVNKSYNLKSELDNFNLITTNDESKIMNKYIFTDGSLDTLNGWVVYTIDVENHSYLNLMFKVYEQLRFIAAFYDNTGTYISGSYIDRTQYQSLNYTIPSGAKYFKISFNYNNVNKITLLMDDIINDLKDNYVKKEDVYGLFQKKTNNILIGVYWLDGYYVDSETGSYAALATFSATSYIRVLPNYVYAVKNTSTGARLAFYDNKMQYISGVIIGSSGYFTTPANAYYIRWCCNTNNKNSSIISLSDDTLYVDTTLGILEGIQKAYSIGAKKVIVKKGNYDIIQEYITKYGATYFDDYSGVYNNYINGYYDAGVWLENIEIKFESGAYVTCNYLGNNSDVKLYFSAFAVGRNVIVDGLNLVSSEIRYGLHPDFNGASTAVDESYFIVKNCDLSHVKGDYNCQCLGCGLPVTGYWVLENNIFRTPLDTKIIVVRIHNNEFNNAVSKVIIKNNYIVGKGYIAMGYYSISQKITDVLASGNSWINPIEKYAQTEESFDNINIIEWNNETRS